MDIRTLKYAYILLKNDVFQEYGYIVSMIVAYSCTDQAKLRCIEDRQLEIRNEYFEAEKMDARPTSWTIMRWRGEYFELMRERKSILKRVSKEQQA